MVNELCGAIQKINEFPRSILLIGSSYYSIFYALLIDLAEYSLHSCVCQEDVIVFKQLSGFVRDQSGATAIEYGLIAALVSVAAITALGSMGNALVTIFNRVSSELNAAAAP